MVNVLNRETCKEPCREAPITRLKPCLIVRQCLTVGPIPSELVANNMKVTGEGGGGSLESPPPEADAF